MVKAKKTHFGNLQFQRFMSFDYFPCMLQVTLWWVFVGDAAGVVVVIIVILWIFSTKRILFGAYVSTDTQHIQFGW